MALTRIVLVRPELAANVGASARVVANTGLAGLDLVGPTDWRSLDAWRTAWGATSVLEEARVFDGLGAAVGEADYVVGFSRRAQEGITLDVRQVAREVQALASTATAALVFGSESSGLSLDELALCGRVAAIASHPGQPSLNLSHAVMVAAYEVFRAAPSTAPRSTLATHAEKERVLALLFDGLRAIHVLGEAQRGVYRRLWRGLLQRMDLTPREARALAHMARKMARAGRPARTRKNDARPGGTAREAPPPPAALEAERPNPFTDVELVDGGFSIPRLKWRELLFVGALRPEGDLFVRDPAHPLPPFERADLFPPGARFEVRGRGGRVELRRRQR